MSDEYTAVRTITCDSCKEEVGVNSSGVILAHNIPDTYGPVETCPNSRLSDLNPPSGGVPTVSGGAFESNRRRH